MPTTEDTGPSVTTVSVEDTGALEIDGELRESFGKYELKRHLATGGMAEIYLAEQVGPEGFAKEIVIKRILPHLAKDQQFTDMFLDEARLAANLNHPNIGQIHELGDAGGDYFIAMEFIDGASIEELIESGATVPYDVAARVVADVLKALDFAHESKDRDGNPLNLVHRDVTPSNVMVSIDGIVKLVDFGVAKAAKKSHKTQTGAVKGKFAYMAPEQVESRDIDRRADIFAIGIVFYELLTGVKPFGDELAAVSKILHSEADDPREVNPDIPEPFAKIIMRALSKEPKDRYPTAHTMQLDIETGLRMVNSYVGPRELSIVVREFRGLELPPGADLSVSDTGLFAADRSSEFLPGDVTTGRGKNLALMDTAAIDVREGGAAVEEAPDAPLESATDSTPEAAASRSLSIPIPKISRRMVIIGVSALVGLLVVAAASTWLANRESVSPLVTGEPSTVVLNTTPLVADGAKPDLLFDKNGVPVLIESIPPTRVYRRGNYIGTTPIQTKLSDGKYRLELELGDERKKVQVEVEKSRFNRARFVYADLEADEKPRSIRKRGRKGGSLKSKLRRLF